MQFKTCLAASVVAATVAVGVLSAPAHAAPAKNVVLVHGALADGSGWRPVYDILTKDGYHVSVVQQPMTSLDDDVAATKRILAMQDGPTVLVGHSYGGQIISEAGDDPKVKALVYIAALQPDVGESVGKLAGSMPAPSNDIKKTDDGQFLYLDP
ncbi:MAG: alpha/beta hydrolase, partial [Parafilimonas terrae]|nr:alpha/beta hydrolase [Parafilimonas terrae]